MGLVNVALYETVCLHLSYMRICCPRDHVILFPCWTSLLGSRRYETDPFGLSQTCKGSPSSIEVDILYLSDIILHLQDHLPGKWTTSFRGKGRLHRNEMECSSFAEKKPARELEVALKGPLYSLGTGRPQTSCPDTNES